MAKGSKTTSAPRSTKADKVGPPLLILGLGYASILVSLPLIAFDSVGAHVVGYVTGALIPILVIGFVRRIDLERRRSPYYEASKLLSPAIAVLGVAAVVAAGLHVWPIATELAS